MSALVRIVVAAVMAALFVPLRFLGRLFFPRAFAEARRTVEAAWLPERIQLVSEPHLPWRDRPALFRLEGELRAAGFRPIGLYRASGLEGVQLAALAHPEDGICAVVYETPREGVWLDLVARLADGSSVVATNKPVPGRIVSRPGSRRLHHRRARPRKLLAQLRRAIGDRRLERLDATNFAFVFEEDYAAESAWQKSEREGREPRSPRSEDVRLGEPEPRVRRAR